jgi:hypothetical protein
LSDFAGEDGDVTNLTGQCAQELWRDSVRASVPRHTLFQIFLEERIITTARLGSALYTDGRVYFQIREPSSGPRSLHTGRGSAQSSLHRLVTPVDGRGRDRTNGTRSC